MIKKLSPIKNKLILDNKFIILELRYRKYFPNFINLIRIEKDTYFMQSELTNSSEPHHNLQHFEIEFKNLLDKYEQNFPDLINQLRQTNIQPLNLVHLKRILNFQKIQNIFSRNINKYMNYLRCKFNFYIN